MAFWRRAAQSRRWRSALFGAAERRSVGQPEVNTWIESFSTNKSRTTELARRNRTSGFSALAAMTAARRTVALGSRRPPRLKRACEPRRLKAACPSGLRHGTLDSPTRRVRRRGDGIDASPEVFGSTRTLASGRVRYVERTSLLVPERGVRLVFFGSGSYHVPGLLRVFWSCCELL